MEQSYLPQRSAMRQKQPGPPSAFALSPMPGRDDLHGFEFSEFGLQREGPLGSHGLRSASSASAENRVRSPKMPEQLWRFATTGSAHRTREGIGIQDRAQAVGRSLNHGVDVEHRLGTVSTRNIACRD